MNKTFPCRVDFPLMRVSSRITLTLVFWFSLGLFRISNVRHKYFELCQALGSPLLSTHGLGSVRPNVILFFTLSVAPFTLWVRHDLYGRTLRVTVWYYLGLTVKENLGWRLKIIEVDGSPRGDGLRLFDDRLSSIYEPAACHFTIGFSIGSKRDFVFRALQVYI